MVNHTYIESEGNETQLIVQYDNSELYTFSFDKETYSIE
jgi:hypothetical protein